MKPILLAAAVAMAPAGAAMASTPSGNDPVEPFKIADNLYYVGASDITSYLVKTPEGMILLDGGYDVTAPLILANIRKLGIDPKQVKILINSHAHLDHAGGLAEIKRVTGAKLLASRADAPGLQAGDRGDPAKVGEFPPVKVDGFVTDNQQVELGGVHITAHLTPGHTAGCTSWTLPVQVEGKTLQALFICSVSVLPAYRLVKNPTYPTIAADYDSTFAELKRLPCDIFLGSHGSFYHLTEKRAALAKPGPNPFVDQAGCKAFITEYETNFRKRLAEEKGASS